MTAFRVWRGGHPWSAKPTFFLLHISHHPFALHDRTCILYAYNLAHGAAVIFTPSYL